MAIVNNSAEIAITPDYLISTMGTNPLRIPLINVSGVHYKYYIVSILPQVRGLSTSYIVTVDYGRIGRNPQHTEYMTGCDLRTAANEAYQLYRKKCAKGYTRINSERFNFIPLADRGMIAELNSINSIKTQPLRIKRKPEKKEKTKGTTDRFDLLII